MAITTTPLGSNSASIVYDAGTALADLITAVENYITAHGWAVYDASAGTNARAYRALNADGVSYKYVVLNYNTASVLWIYVYESWNSGTHAGTNQAEVGAYPEIDLTNGGTLYCFVTSKWLLVRSVSNLGTWSSFVGGLVEIRRELPEDTAIAGIPPYAYVSSTVGAQYAPRIKNGNTGYSAAYNTAHIFGTTLSAVPATANNWNSKYFVVDLYAFNSLAVGYEYRGLWFGIKGYASGQGANMDDMTLNVDSDYKLVSSGGTPTDYWIMAKNASNDRVIIPK